MSVKLNLLPEEFSVSKPVATVLKIVRPLNVTLLSIFLASALGMAGFFIFGSITLRNLNTENNNLKTQIQAQSEAQQQAVLLKDRLEKIRKVIAMPNASKNNLALFTLADSLTDNSKIVEMDISPQTSSLSIAFKTNSELTNFMNQLSSQVAFSEVALDSFSYNPAGGYVVSVSFTGK